jgi:hypothetical protein
MSSQANKLVDTATYYIGYLEKASNYKLEDFTANASSANYTLFGQWYGINPGAWCAMFVSYCADKAGIPAGVIPRFADCNDGVEGFQKLGRWHARNGYIPKVGDIIFYTHDGSTSAHVGIVWAVDGSTAYTIEGNTSGGSTLIDNGGGVAKKSYPLTYASILGYGNPAYTPDEVPVLKGTTMNIVTGSTANETKLIKGIQAAAGAVVDGEIGTQTLSDIACKFKADCFPLTLKIYGAPVIISNDIIPVATPGTGLSYYDNSMNGSFYMEQDVGGNVPCSILVSGGVVKRSDACHASLGFPESALYRTKNGMFGITRAKTVKDLPDEISWAVGGMGLLYNYDPKAEGFTGKFADVTYVNNHAMLGIKNGHVYMVYCAAMSSDQCNAFAKLIGLEKAILLDGGHIAGMNGSESFAKINTAITQYYMIQAIN